MIKDSALLKPVTPKEHGVWVIGLVPFLTAAFIAFPRSGRSTTSLLFFLGAVVSFFMAFTPFISLLKRRGKGLELKRDDRDLLWAAIYTVLAAIFFVYVLFSTKLLGLILFIVPIGAIFLFYCSLLVAGEHRDNLSMDLLGASGLCLVAPMVYYISLERLDITAIMIYVINLGFFSSRVMFAKLMIDLQKNDSVLADFKSRRKYFKKVSLWNVAVIHVLVACSVMKIIPSLAITSLLPGSVYTWKQIFSLKEKPNIRSVGFKEMGVALFFSAVLIYAYH
ncbi:MAG: YwiC-like family protein [Nitrospinae bacterium]|nr:YwiC-like family protein [Nitrospinota bacterium]